MAERDITASLLCMVPFSKTHVLCEVNQQCCCQAAQMLLAVYDFMPGAARYNSWLLIKLMPNAVVFYCLLQQQIVEGPKQESWTNLLLSLHNVTQQLALVLAASINGPCQLCCCLLHILYHHFLVSHAQFARSAL